MHPTIFFDPAFVVNVIAGWILTAGGVVLLLVAGIWASVAEPSWLRGTPKPTAWRGLCTIGLAAFIAGWLWQIVGYYRIGALTF